MHAIADTDRAAAARATGRRWRRPYARHDGATMPAAFGLAGYHYRAAAVHYAAAGDMVNASRCLRIAHATDAAAAVEVTR